MVINDQEEMQFFKLLFCYEVAAAKTSTSLSYFLWIFTFEKIKNPQDYQDEVLEWNIAVKPCNHASLYTYAWVLSRFSHVQLLAILWTVACQVSLSMEFSRQGLSCPPPGDLPDPAIEPTTPESSALQEDSLPLSHRGIPILDTKMEA